MFFGGLPFDLVSIWFHIYFMNGLVQALNFIVRDIIFAVECYRATSWICWIRIICLFQTIREVTSSRS